MEESFWKRSARDIIALGGIPFFVLVVVRVWILRNPEYLFQFLLGGLFVLSISRFMDFDHSSGLSIVVAFFLSLYYGDLLFTIFAGVALVLVFVSLFVLGVDKNKVFGGGVLGVAGSAISFAVVRAIWG
jgi:hypothetical protein